MNKRQRTALERYFRECAAILNLDEWLIRVEAELLPSDDSADAMIQPQEQYRVADVRVSAAFLKKTPAEQREDVAHELGHLWTARMDRACEYLDGADTKVKMFKQVHADAEEYAVEQIARFISSALPLPKL